MMSAIVCSDRFSFSWYGNDMTLPSTGVDILDCIPLYSGSSIRYSAKSTSRVLTGGRTEQRLSSGMTEVCLVSYLLRAFAPSKFSLSTHVRNAVKIAQVVNPNSPRWQAKRSRLAFHGNPYLGYDTNTLACPRATPLLESFNHI